MAVESTRTDGGKFWATAKGLVVPQKANPSHFGRIWDRWLGDAVFAISSAGISFLGAILGFQRPDNIGWTIVGLATCALLIAFVPIVRHIRDTARQADLDNQVDRIVETKAREFYAFNSVITPSIRRLAKLAASKTNGIDETKEYSTILTTVLESATRLTGGNGEVRAVFFRKTDVNRGRKLEQADYAGSREPSGRVFTDSARDPAGQAAWKALERGKVRTWSNLDVNTPDGWADAVRRKPQSRPYKTFSMAPVQGPDGQIYGMLNVDALAPGSFDDLDEERLAALAAILGPLFTWSRRGKLTFLMMSDDDGTKFMGVPDGGGASMTSTAWLAQVPARSEAQRKADREKVARALDSARKKMERSEQMREARSRSAAALSAGKQAR